MLLAIDWKIESENIMKGILHLGNNRRHNPNIVVIYIEFALGVIFLWDATDHAN